jgi:TatD DNase family protein
MLDAHCHIDLYQDPYQTALESEHNRIFTLAVTRLPSHFVEALEYLRNFRYVRPALGFHPLLIAQYPEEIAQFEPLLDLTRYIGEVGLDFTVRDEGKRSRQVEVFEHILGLARRQDKVFSIHSRQAETQVLDLLIRYDCSKCIFHWYSGSLRTLQRILEHGFYLSINHQMLSTISGRRIIQSSPIDRILTETDGPFIKLNGREIRPMDIKLTELGLAELWGLDSQEVTNIIRQNFKNFLTLDSLAIAQA